MKPTKADLHIHSNVSDGSWTFKEIVDEAVAQDLTHISLTNHDTTLFQQEAIDYGKEKNIIVITGIEISGKDVDVNKKVHILGYNYLVNTPILNDFCKDILSIRNQNTIETIKRLKNENYDFDEENILCKISKSNCLYKQHLLEELMAKGYADEYYGDFYKEKLQKHSKESYADAVEAIKKIVEAGGIPVLAHPGLYNNYDEIEKYVNAGLKGIECYHESQSKEDEEKIIELSVKYKLFLTGGSDFHGKYGGSTPIGKKYINYVNPLLL